MCTHTRACSPDRRGGGEIAYECYIRQEWTYGATSQQSPVEEGSEYSQLDAGADVDEVVDCAVHEGVAWLRLNSVSLCTSLS